MKRKVWKLMNRPEGLNFEDALSLVEEELVSPTDNKICLLYTSPSPRDATLSRMPSSA